MSGPEDDSVTLNTSAEHDFKDMYYYVVEKRNVAGVLPSIVQ